MIPQSKIENPKSKIVRGFRRMCWHGRIESFGDTRSFTFVQDKFWIFDFRFWIESRENKS